MRVIIFDTETNGLIPKDKNIVTENLDKMPYIVQLSFILFDTNSMRIVVEHDFIIQVPENIEISDESAKIHGISKQISRVNGVSIQDALSNFQICLNKADVVIAHNITFDIDMIAIESLRNQMDVRKDFIRKINYCTMKRTVNLCKIVAVNKKDVAYYKYPTLTQLHEYLFDETPLGTHNSMADVYICLRCYYKIKFDGDLCENIAFKKKFYKICK
jgi:DNA polymerase III epsilon subunit-like protein